MSNVSDATLDTCTFHIFILYQPPDLTTKNTPICIKTLRNLPKVFIFWVPFAYIFIQDFSRFMLGTLPISYLKPCKI